MFLVHLPNAGTECGTRLQNNTFPVESWYRIPVVLVSVVNLLLKAVLLKYGIFSPSRYRKVRASYLLRWAMKGVDIVKAVFP